MRLERGSPMPPTAAFLMHGVRIALLDWLSLLGVLLLGVLPFGALGLAIGYLFGPNSAPVVLNLLYMPMAIASGLWMPITVLPPVVQSVAPYLPTYHYAQLALRPVGATPPRHAARHALVLAGFAAVFLVVAVAAYKRDEGKTYG